MKAFIDYIEARQPETPRETAEHLGISRPFLYDLKGGRREPNLETAVKLERATGGQVPVASWGRFKAVANAIDASPASPTQGAA